MNIFNLIKKFINILKNNYNIISLGSVPGMLFVGNSVYSTKNVVHNSWIQNNDEIYGDLELFLLFSIFWAIVMFFITFINIGLSSLLFLLEVGLLTPIGSMVAVGLVPLSSVLYILNAITMEAVVGVIIAIAYSKDWKYRDFTKNEVLESSLNYPLHIFGLFWTLSTKPKNLFFNSWSFIEYLKLKFKIFNFKNIFIFLLSLSFIINMGISDLWVSIVNYFNIYDIYGNLTFYVNFLKYNISDKSKYFDLSDNSYKKNFEQYSFYEFLNKKNLIYINFNKFLLNLEFYSGNSIFFFNEFIGNNLMLKSIYKDIRIANNTRLRYSYIENPSDILINILSISGNYYSGFNKNNSILSYINDSDFILGKKDYLGLTNFSDINSSYLKITDFNNYNIFKPISEVFWENIFFKIFENNTSTDNSILKNTYYDLYDISLNFKNYSLSNSSKLYDSGIIKKTYTNKNLKKFKSKIFNFNIYNNFLKFTKNKYTNSLNFFENSFENSLINRQINYNFRPNYYKNNKFLKKIIKNTEFSKISNYNSLIIYKPNLNSIKNIFSNNYEKFKNNVVNVKSTHSKILMLNKFFFKYNYSMNNYVKIKKQNHYFNLKLSLYLPKIVNFHKKRSFINFHESKYFRNFFLIYNFSNSININSNFDLDFFYSNSKISWNSKNKDIIFNIGSNNLPWFENSDHDLLNLDGVSNNIHSLNVYSNELKILPNLENFFLYNSYENNKFLTNFNKSRLLRKSYRYENKFWKNTRSRSLKRKKRTKSPLWKLKLNWKYNFNFENLYKYLYKNTNVTYFENKQYLSRFYEVGKKSPILNSRLITKYGNSGFGGSFNSVYSNQSRKFGLIFIDNHVFSNFSNLKSDIINPNSFFLPILKKKLFSYLQFYEKNLPNLNNLVNITNIGKFKNNKQKKIIGNRFLKNKNNNIFLKTSKLFLNSSKYSNISSLKNTTRLKPEFNISDKKLKVFWKPEDFNNEVSGTYKKFENKRIVSDRFLLTFKKIIIERDNNYSYKVFRLDNQKLNNSKISNFLLNSNRMVNMPKWLNSESTTFNSQVYNMTAKNNNKLTITDDLEVSDKFIRSYQTKPHTLYGLLWDEYLKQTYGFSLNFLNFENKIKDFNYEFKFNNFLNFNGLGFQNNLENNLSNINKNVGLTKDSEFANIITSKILTSRGFFKDINKNTKLEEFILGKHKNFKKALRLVSKKLYKNKFKHKKKINKYFKKKLIKDTISKNRIIKSTIKFIKKYKETPVGFKYSKIPVGDSLPYLKRKFWVKNEINYTTFIGPKYKNWLTKKNETFDIFNRSYFTKLSRFKKNKKKYGYFKNIFFYKKFLKLKNTEIGKIVDYKSKSFIKKKSKNKIIGGRIFNFNDKLEFDLSKKKFSIIKRNLKKIKTRRSIFKKKFRILKRSSLRLLKHNTLNKKFHNYKSFYKNKIIGNDIIGGGLYLRYGNEKKINNFVFLNEINNIRKNKKFEDYNIFNNTSIKIIRSSEFNLKNSLDNLNNYQYVQYKNLIKKELSYDYWNNHLSVKNIKNDSNYFENVLLKFNSKTKNISNIYKLSQYSKTDILGIGNSLLNFEINNIGFSVLNNYGEFNPDSNFFNNFEISSYEKSIDMDNSVFLKNNKFNSNNDNSIFFKKKIEKYKFLLNFNNFKYLNKSNNLNILNLYFNKNMFKFLTVRNDNIFVLKSQEKLIKSVKFLFKNLNLFNIFIKFLKKFLNIFFLIFFLILIIKIKKKIKKHVNCSFNN